MPVTAFVVVSVASLRVAVSVRSGGWSGLI